MGIPLRRQKEAHGDRAEPDALAEVLQRLWQTKLSSIALIEQWARETSDPDIQAGLRRQLVDERRHLRMIGEQLRRLGTPITAEGSRDAILRPFLEVKVRQEDWQRLFLYYQGIKVFTINRCNQLVTAVAPAVAQALDQIARDEERHVRWAEVRLERFLTSERARESQFLLARIRASLEASWGKPGRQLRVVPRQ
jgi:rubrerythrin